MRINILSLFLVNFLTVCSIYSIQSHVQSDIFYEISKCNLKAVKKWSYSKPDVSVFNDQGQSVLTAAVLTGNYNLVKAILKSFVDINMFDKQGKTALDLACEHGYEKIVFMLVKKGAKVTCHDTLQQARSIVSGYCKKVMRRFYIILPILVLFFPFIPYIVVGAACAGGPLVQAAFWFGVVFTYTPITFYMLTLPVQATTWSVRSHRIGIVG